MLQAIRSQVGSWVVKILFILLIVSFAVWGVGDMVGGAGTNRDVATVGDASIGPQQLDREFRQLIEQYRRVFGGTFDTEQARQFGLVDQALQGLIEQAVFDQAAARTGIRVSDDLVRQEIQQVPAFRNPAGRFDPELFRRVLFQNGLTEQDLVQLIRQDISRRQLVGAVSAGAAAPAQLVADLYRHQAERRTVELVTIPPEHIADLPTPGEEQLARFHAENPGRFTRPETRDVTVLKVTVDDLLGEVTATEEEITQAFAARAAEFQTPERRSVDLVQGNDRETLERIVAGVRGGSELALAVAEAGREIIPVETARKEDLFAPAIGDAAFATAEGAISDPVETPLGWYVVRVRNVQPAVERTLDQVREQIALDVRRDKASDRLYDFTNRLEDALAGGQSLEATAERFQIRLEKLGRVDARGRLPDGRPAADIPGLPQILSTAFQQAPGRDSRLLETREGTFYAVRVDAVHPEELRPLAEVRDAVVAAWEAAERNRLARELADTIVARVQGGTTLAEAVVADGLTLSTPPAFTRDDRGTGVPLDVVQQAFALPEGGIAAVETGSGAVVVRVTGIRAPDPAAAPAEVATLSRTVEQSIGRDLADQFANALRQTIPVEINRTAINQLFGGS